MLIQIFELFLRRGTLSFHLPIPTDRPKSIILWIPLLSSCLLANLTNWQTAERKKSGINFVTLLVIRKSNYDSGNENRAPLHNAIIAGRSFPDTVIYTSSRGYWLEVQNARPRILLFFKRVEIPI